MAIILPNNIVYLHIPKTGGSWLSKIIEANNLVVSRIGYKHATFDSITGGRSLLTRKGWRDAFARKFYLRNRPTFFCVVRHPLDWYESWFSYQAGLSFRNSGTNGCLRDWSINSDLNAMSSTSFNDFMRDVNRLVPGYVAQLYARYINNSSAVVLHHETLATDFLAFCERFRLTVSRESVVGSGRVNVSRTVNVEWDPQILRQTIDNERAAFQRYGYDPEQRYRPAVAALAKTVADPVAEMAIGSFASA